MTDLHCHILPGIDDGAKDPSVSLAMLRMQAEQGMDTVVLTSHFYRHREHLDRFLSRRAAAWERLTDKLAEAPDREKLPRLLLGAEVAWTPNLMEDADLDRLCIGSGRFLLLELPFQPWDSNMVRQIYDLIGRTGVTPVLAHIERYLKFQRRDLVDAVLDLGVPVQISAGLLTHPFSRGMALRLLRNDTAQFIASDCHDTDKRKPNMGPALEVLRKKMGRDFVEEMGRLTDRLAGGGERTPAGAFG